MEIFSEHLKRMTFKAERGKKEIQLVFHPNKAPPEMSH